MGIEGVCDDEFDVSEDVVGPGFGFARLREPILVVQRDGRNHRKRRG